jgi:hypothetical protein
MGLYSATHVVYRKVDKVGVIWSPNKGGTDFVMELCDDGLSLQMNYQVMSCCGLGMLHPISYVRTLEQCESIFKLLHEFQLQKSWIFLDESGDSHVFTKYFRDNHGAVPTHTFKNARYTAGNPLTTWMLHLNKEGVKLDNNVIDVIDRTTLSYKKVPSTLHNERNMNVMRRLKYAHYPE